MEDGKPSGLTESGTNFVGLAEPKVLLGGTTAGTCNEACYNTANMFRIGSKMVGDGCNGGKVVLYNVEE